MEWGNQSEGPDGGGYHGLVWAAIAAKRPIGAVYEELSRLFCPH